MVSKKLDILTKVFRMFTKYENFDKKDEYYYLNSLFNKYIKHYSIFINKIIWNRKYNKEIINFNNNPNFYVNKKYIAKRSFGEYLNKKKKVILENIHIEYNKLDLTCNLTENDDLGFIFKNYFNIYYTNLLLNNKYLTFQNTDINLIFN
jgi:hypothetical protein